GEVPLPVPVGVGDDVHPPARGRLGCGSLAHRIARPAHQPTSVLGGPQHRTGNTVHDRTNPASVPGHPGQPSTRGRTCGRTCGRTGRSTTGSAARTAVGRAVAWGRADRVRNR